MIMLRETVPHVIQEKIHGYFLDLCLLQHKMVFKPCMKQIVFSNPVRMKEVQEEMSDAVANDDHGTLEEHLRFGHKCYMNPFNSDYTSLDFAILFGKHECVKIILNYTTSLEGIELCGDGPVVLAIKYRRLSILRMLLRKGFNPWGTNHAPAIQIMEWGSMYDAIDVYIDCGIHLTASHLLKTGCTGILKHLMEKGFDPTQELYVELRDDCDWRGTRQNLYKLIYSSCVSLNIYNWLMLSRFTDHDGVEKGGGLLQVNTENSKLLSLLKKNREEHYERFSFLWLQE